MALRPELLTKRIFRSGQLVPLDGMYGDLWGSFLPLLQGETFPSHREMGESKWTYKGSLGMGLPEERKRASFIRQVKER
ncbi:hypothetical protein [Paenibacillus glycinis]|uniref:Uncharacterized protein n=1 Tax=Paenibacillus glycinis TaxID=2697035 RepID=A0ABW9XMD0_9BACL|nr:hypothetical protein [Paenibacillus glycinis]NBD23765.1 hypothetical protein [Paenibacillus glycinis]